VIAIENARLLNELRQRTDDLTESLEQQTATSEVLRVISSSPGELAPVFASMLENATRICRAAFGSMLFLEGEAFRRVAMHNAPPKFAEFNEKNPGLRWKGQKILDRVITTKQVVHVADAAAEDPETPICKFGGARTLLTVPMLKDNDVIGTFGIYRQEVRPFTDKQIELVQNFAAQAVIAIENTRLLNELRESLDRQTATSEVLKVISSSPGELEPVFEAVLENAARICSAQFATMWLAEGDGFRAAAMHNTPGPLAQQRRTAGFHIPEPGTALARVSSTHRFVHIHDLRNEPAYIERAPSFVQAVELGGMRTLLSMPMLKDGKLMGAISITRQEVRPFTDKQIELVQNFAAQAVIAIENARLLNELRQRTDDLTESLEQQTATSEILASLSSSVSDSAPVFEAIARNTLRLFGTQFTAVFLLRGGMMELGAVKGSLELEKSFVSAFPQPVSYDTLTGKVLRSGRPIQVTPIIGNPESTPEAERLAQTFDYNSMLIAPMIRDGKTIGAIGTAHREAVSFTAKQIELVQNFAAQAVIAIENTRLLNELRQRTDDLSEALEQQTATSEVLKVISSSPGELKAVFDAMLENATRICRATFGNLALFEGDQLRMLALHGPQGSFANLRRRDPIVPVNQTPVRVVVETRQPVQVTDLAAGPEYADLAIVKLAGARTIVVVPMLKDDVLIGAISVFRQEVLPFTDKQIELLTNFAAQAVIAIENTRLLNELRESLQQQTATADVLKVISRSTFDLQPVFDSMAESAVRLCEAERAYIFRFDGKLLRAVASFNAGPENQDWVYRNPIPLGRHSVSARAGLERRTVQVTDVQADPEYGYVARDVEPIHTTLAVPMLKGDELIGTITIYRLEVKPFTEKQIALMETFADQAVIAIENVRLFDEIQDKSRQLAEASQHKSQFLANMSHELRTPLNAILGYTELIADGIYGAPSDKMHDVLKRIESNGRHLLGLINDVLDLSKIEAGQLVLALADYSLKDVVLTVHSGVEALAAEKKLVFKVEMPADLPSGRGDERRLTQVLLNLVSNAIKFTDAGEVAIKVGAADGLFSVAVRDTGPGISAADQQKLFQEFQQADNSITRKKGGTGLGLAISKRIVELHGGRIWVDSAVGRGSTFAFTVPVAVDQPAKTA
jgi:signal transduction histidine kinase